MSEKKSNIKDWLMYIEDDKVKAFDISSHDKTDELIQLCEESCGIELCGFVAFEHEKDAIFYCEVNR
jgi:hypothetical protein